MITTPQLEQQGESPLGSCACSPSFEDWWNDQENGCPTLVLDNDEQFARAVWDAAIKLKSALMVRLYNQGYHAGACFAPIHHTDMDTYHADVVAEILQENAIGEARRDGTPPQQ